MKKMNFNWTFNEVLERFEAIEKKLHLDESIIQGVPWWDTLRYQLFNELLSELGLREDFKKKKTLTIKEFLVKKIFNVFFIIKNLIKIFLPKSPLWMKNNSNVILGHPRRKFEEGAYVDLYSNPFIDLFPKKINFSVIEGNDHFSPAKTKYLFYAESLYTIANIISKFRSLNLIKKTFYSYLVLKNLYIMNSLV